MTVSVKAKSTSLQYVFAFLILLFSVSNCVAQDGSCPLNIDFESGNFFNWQCYAGSTTTVGNSNVITVSKVGPTPGIHQVIPKGTVTDPYGGFPISAPDGSGYSVKLGNDGTGSQAERISYDLTVPDNQKDFVITYQYAVVLQDPGHPPEQQPRFTAKVFDVTKNQYITCGSFEYVATSALPGFKNAANGSAIYKEWTPVSINLYGYEGHKLRLEFTTADCTQSGHFGYAYIDINNSCSELIKGTSFCSNYPQMTLNGPPGFEKYNWYSDDHLKLLGSGKNLILPTAGLDGKTIQLDVIPYEGFGCNYTITAQLRSYPTFNFVITDPPAVCVPLSVDITAKPITALSDNGLKYSYWQDATATKPLTQPAAIKKSGTYYIKCTSLSGCEEIKPVNVLIYDTPELKITDPVTVCADATVDLTSDRVTIGSTSGLTYTYWTDPAASKALTNPSAVNTANTYFIKGTNASGCFAIKPVQVTFFPLPSLIITNPQSVCIPFSVDITAASVTSGSESGLTLSYWKDASATSELSLPQKVSKSGTYYIKAINNNGCQIIKPVVVTMYELPELHIVSPPELCYPDKCDLTQATLTAGSKNVDHFTYWMDEQATKQLSNPRAVTDSGVYYIKAISIHGCETISPVSVVIHQPPVLVTTDPPKLYAPRTIDITREYVTSGSSPRLELSYFKDAEGLESLETPKAITTSGTYYIKATNNYGCSSIKPVNVTIAAVPQIMVPTAFTPTQAENNRLFPFLIGIKTFKFFKIFDRWGTLIYQTDSSDPSSGWDGVYKGEVHFLDTVTWYAQGYDQVGNLVQRSGNTILLK